MHELCINSPTHAFSLTARPCSLVILCVFIRTPQSQSMTLLLLHNKTPPLWTRTHHTLSRTPLPHNRTALIRILLPHNRTALIRTLLPHNRTAVIRTLFPHNRTAVIRTLFPHNRTALIRTLLPHNRTALIRTLLPHNRMCWTLVRSDLLLVLEDREDYL